jgi:hypothetical protein
MPAPNCDQYLDGAMSGSLAAAQGFGVTPLQSRFDPDLSGYWRKPTAWILMWLMAKAELTTTCLNAEKSFYHGTQTVQSECVFDHGQQTFGAYDDAN